MAEARRRSEVSKFAHRTQYPTVQSPIQRSLFTDRDWHCEFDRKFIPVVGDKVLVKVGSNEFLDVFSGNQKVARVIDVLGTELISTLNVSGRGGGAAATIVSSDSSKSPFGIRLL